MYNSLWDCWKHFAVFLSFFFPFPFDMLCIIYSQTTTKQTWQLAAVNLKMTKELNNSITF